MLTTGCRTQLTRNAEQCEKNVYGNPDLALRGCTALIASGQLSNDDLVKVLTNRGIVYSNKADYDQAIRDFDKALSLRPGTVEALNGRGLAYEQKGNFDRAIEDYSLAIRLRPDFADAFNNRALVYAEHKRDHVCAIQDFDRALQLRPGYAEALTNRAHSLHAIGEYDRAIRDYGEAIKLEPGQAGGFFDRAFAFSAKKEYARALADLDHALRLKPKDPVILWTRGATNLILGRFLAARDDLSQSLELKPKDPYHAIWLYMASSRAGQDAKDELKRNSATLVTTSWPGSAVQMFLGSLPARDFVASAGSPDESIGKDQFCRAFFYLGEDAVLRGKLPEARKLFGKSIAFGSTISYEYIGAVAELDRLDAQR
ncbi:MAG TPA: tetratricopeptide repeat protein [Bryobacteraceae bacterium]|nr:tetratricopeptide repeat protein [Bryobacteraceae bacterium]